MHSIANFTHSAGLATNPIGPEAVVPLSYGCAPTALDGSNPGAPIFTTPGPPFPPAGANIFFTPRNLVTSYVQNWNLTIEQELAGSAAFQLGYVESKGTKLVRLRDANQPELNGDRPNANFGFMDEFATISASTYHALQATLRGSARRILQGCATSV